MADMKRTRRRNPSDLLIEDIWPPMPVGRLACYTKLWQLELWLREIVYVELSARYGTAWADQIDVQSGKRSQKPPKKRPQLAGARSIQADSRLTHMPTRERSPLSYIAFDALLKIISRHRRLFAPYLPVKSVWDARLEEIRQIRNRVAHFRNGHPADLQRVTQMLDDIDKGVWRFVTTYNEAHPIYPAKRDPVARQFITLDPFPWSAAGDGIARFGIAPPDLRFGVTIEALRRPWLLAKPTGQIAGRYGYLYDVHITARQGRGFDYLRFLQATKRYHPLCCHIVLDRMGNGVRLTMPAINAAAQIVDGIDKFITATEHALLRSPNAQDVQLIVDDWPEYVLASDNPMAFLSPDMPSRMTRGSER
ncbi:hypothetical protein ABID19_002993 [Mesorhizobium robiniae]|uniref:Swt1-like HEPN domain-containing protein n=1 Tax=Mesorhizobium robiniae TaxID=559315 RepID=A0ABV2GP66_9HYPH